jgi:hypothetical protein
MVTALVTIILLLLDVPKRLIRNLQIIKYCFDIRFGERDLLDFFLVVK